MRLFALLRISGSQEPYRTIAYVLDSVEYAVAFLAFKEFIDSISLVK